MLALRILVILAATAASVPSASASDLEIADRGVFIPSLRLGFDIAPREGPLVPLGPSAPHTGHGIEIGISGASGDDKQTLGTGDSPVVFGGRIFGAGELRHEFDFRFLEIAYRYRHFFGNRTFGIEALGGLGIAELEVTTSSALQSASDKLSDGGLVGGFGIIWNFLPRTSLQSRLTLFGSGSTEGVTGAARFDVHVAHALARHVALRAGLVSWGVVSQRADDDNSSLNSRIVAGFSGLSLGLDVAF
jgi:hypothetical protein